MSDYTDDIDGYCKLVGFALGIQPINMKCRNVSDR